MDEDLWTQSFEFHKIEDDIKQEKQFMKNKFG